MSVSTNVRTSPSDRHWLGRGLLAAAFVVAVVAGARGLGDEGSFSEGDPPRYMMNGVFGYDLLTSGTPWTVDAVRTYAERYFARYPALSLGHHPPLLSIVLVPCFALFGISVHSVRLALLAMFVVVVWLTYTLARRQYTNAVAGWAALLLASLPFLTQFAQRAMSEMPAIVLVLGAINALLRFRGAGRVSDYGVFVFLAALSLTARPSAVFIVPAYAAILIAEVGWSRLLRRDVLLWSAAGAILAVPVALATALWSPFNVQAVHDVLLVWWRLEPFPWSKVLRPALQAHLLPALWFPILIGLAAAWRRDRRIAVALYWSGAVLAGLIFTGPIAPDRYTVLAVPAFCLAAASLADVGVSRTARLMTTMVLAVVVVWQISAGWKVRPASEGAYEQAARFVLGNGGGAPTVLYSASLDTGYFVFFVRKHDPAQRLVVLRADKLLTTSLLDRLSVEDRIRSPEEIYPLLGTFGTKFVVIEDRPSGSAVLDMLRAELKGPRFTERLRIPLGSGRADLRGSSLAVYQFHDARPPDPDAVIDMNLPLAGRTIRVLLSDLQPARPR